MTPIDYVRERHGYPYCERAVRPTVYILRRAMIAHRENPRASARVCARMAVLCGHCRARSGCLANTAGQGPHAAAGGVAAVRSPGRPGNGGAPLCHNLHMHATYLCPLDAIYDASLAWMSADTSIRIRYRGPALFPRAILP